MRSGFVAILGRPNVGKSTLLNALLSKKVSIVSPKSQTTRDNISGILNEKDYQIVFVDTPGIFYGEEGLYRYMKKSAFEAAKDVDAIVYMIDVSTKDLDADIKIINSLRSGAPLFLVMNKIDLIKAEDGMRIKEKLQAETKAHKIIEASIKENFGIKEIKESVIPYLSGTMPYYPEDMITDKDKSYQAKEVIRQKILHFLKQEIPHQSAVIIDSMEYANKSYTIEASIIVEKNNHKAIVIGRGGDMIKKISMSARHELERMWHEHIASLEISVECIPNWRNDPRILAKLGYANEK